MTAADQAALAALLADPDRLAALWRQRASGDRLGYEREIAEIRRVAPGLPLGRLEAVLDSLEPAGGNGTGGDAASISGTVPGDDAAGTEQWFGRRLVAEHGADLRWVEPWRRWVAFDAATGRWGAEETGAAWRAAMEVARGLLDEALAVLRAAVEEGRRDALGAARARVAVARRFHGRGALGAGLDLAAKAAEVQAAPALFDGDPYLLAVGAGQVVDLRTGEARPATREDRLMRGTNVEFDPAAPAPTWGRFLARVLPDREVQDYAQRALGYSLTGATREHLLHLVLGPGGSGKSTLFGAALRVVGGYGVVVPEEVLVERRSEAHPTAVTVLHGRRLAVAPELPEGGRLSEARVKTLTGGDAITARRMREDFWEFLPTHKLWAYSNHRPLIRGTDSGIWRRVRLLPMEAAVPEPEQDPDLPLRLADEDAGILAWLVRGCQAYLREGLEPPEAVKMQTRDYRADEDPLGEYVAERLIAVAREQHKETATSAIYADYLAWADARHLPERARFGQRAVTEYLRGHGWELVRKGQARSFADVVLAPTLLPKTSPSSALATENGEERLW